MPKKKYEESNIQAIADTIREKTGGNKLYDTSEMASGVNEVYEAGKLDEHKTFMDTYIDKMNNATTDNARKYMFAGPCWNKNTFYPTKDFVVAGEAFRYHNWWAGGVYDLSARLKECGVKMLSVSPTETFSYAHVTRLPVLDMSKYTTIMMDRTFLQNVYLGTIDKLIIGERAGSINNPFGGCSALANLIVEGVWDRSISFADCPLTVKSMKSIISCLKDHSGTEYEFTYTLTLSSACKTALEAEGATSPNGNLWTEYIDGLGWNLK